MSEAVIQSSSGNGTIPTIEQIVKVPDDIHFHSVVLGVSFHPERNIVAGSTVFGDVKIYSYRTEGENEELMNLNLHKKACCGLQFSFDGADLFTASRDKSIKVVDVETGEVTKKFIKAHDSSIYCMVPVDHFLLASGDDDGEVKVWDLRSQNSILAFKECQDYISSFLMSKDKKTLLATSGEGSLSTFNIRSRKLELQSKLFKHEFLSSAFIKGETKAVIGTGNGALNIFNSGEWGNTSDLFPAHKNSVDSMLAVDDNVVCTGTSNGKIRAVQLYPHKVLGILGDHCGFPIEGLSVSGNQELLASCSHDEKIKFWDLTCIEPLKCDKVTRSDKKGKNIDIALNSKRAIFFSGLE